LIANSHAPIAGSAVVRHGSFEVFASWRSRFHSLVRFTERGASSKELKPSVERTTRPHQRKILGHTPPAGGLRSRNELDTRALGCLLHRTARLGHKYFHSEIRSRFLRRQNVRLVMEFFIPGGRPAFHFGPSVQRISSSIKRAGAKI